MSDGCYKLIRWILGAVFIYAGSIKLLDPVAFGIMIEAYGVIPDRLILPAAILVAAMEVAAGIGLLFDIEGSLAAIAGLLSLFVAILSYGLWIGLDVDCGCFGPDDPEAEAFHGLRSSLYRDLVMLAGIAFLYGWRRYRGLKPVKITSIINSGGLIMRMVNSMLKTMIGIILVIGFAVPAMAFLENKFEKELEKETGAVKLVREVQRGGYAVVTTAELKKWIDSGKPAVIVDTMPYEASYKKNHVPGAVQFLFPIPEMKQWDPKETGGKTQQDFVRLLGGDKNKIIVVYCGFVKCTRSHNGAAWAVRLGYKNVYRHPGGIFAWKGAKYPVEKSE
jgi:rhodanese-related sulfurtransferase/uncharacterized membrane protein YphA (DoxX/SURF4 family)